MFHIFHQTLKRRIAEEKALRDIGDLSSPMLLLTLFEMEISGKQCSQRELARKMGLSPATIAVSLKPLERDGYVERCTDERDARRNLVSLTDKGRDAVKRCEEALRAVDRQMMLGFTAEECDTFSVFLERMIENLGGAELCPCHLSLEKEET